jgi:hypothetical protein
MKKLCALTLLFTLSITVVNAQDEEEKTGGFKKENLFTGGSITLSFFNGQTILGGNPIFGYKIADWVDGGLVFNYIYSGSRDYQYYNDKIRQNIYGGGAFVRLYPVPFLFVQGQLEHNWSKVKYEYPDNIAPDESYKVDATSLLVGGGFASGREKGGTTFYYISLLFDVMKDINSPYVDVNANPSDPADQRVDIAPIIRAGINIGLFQGRYRSR